MTVPKPLENKRILLACSPQKMASLSARLREMGAEILEWPVLAVQEIEDNAELERALGRLDGYDWIFFTSAYAVEIFARRLAASGLGPGLQPKAQICAVGPATAREAERWGLRVSLVPDRFSAEGLIEAIDLRSGGRHGLSGARVLYPRAEQARELLAEALSAAGALVDAIPVYRTFRGSIDPVAVEDIKRKVPNLLVFTSSAAVRNFAEILGDAAAGMLRRCAVSVLGPVTAGTVQAYGKSPEIVPAQNTVDSLCDAIRDWATLPAYS